MSEQIDEAIRQRVKKMQDLSDASRRSAANYLRMAIATSILLVIVIAGMWFSSPGLRPGDRALILDSNGTTQVKMTQLTDAVRSSTFKDEQIKADIGTLLDQYKNVVFDVEHEALKEPSPILMIILAAAALLVAGVMLWAFHYYSYAAARYDDSINALLMRESTDEEDIKTMVGVIEYPGNIGSFAVAAAK